MVARKRVDGVTYEKLEFTPAKEDMEFGKVYISDEYKSSSHLCMCGCGQLVITPLGGGKNWDYSIDSKDKLTLHGSVKNRMGCKVHYVIHKGQARIF